MVTEGRSALWEDRVDAVDARPEVEGLLRRRVAGLGDAQGSEGDAEGIECLCGPGTRVDDGADLP